ncbi:hypothetical protein Tco_0262266 [Tanacetum coccineum]
MKTTKKDSAITKRLQAGKRSQRCYANVSRKPLEFQVGDRVMLKVSPRKVAHKLELPEEISNVYSTFHVSNLKKCLSDESLVIPMKELQLDNKLNFVEEPVKIMDREVKQLKQSYFHYTVKGPLYEQRPTTIMDSFSLYDVTWDIVIRPIGIDEFPFCV